MRRMPPIGLKMTRSGHCVVSVAGADNAGIPLQCAPTTTHGYSLV